ncbi:hypothetical protein IC63_13365 [Paracoccus sphaerophysae]|uniref:Uncharacterized protein n=2 Tax=Paracoccus sphaerophysae TaxID=690417 RepID=A0A099EY72_9RHOB|nr:hypothetical protein IC63_13365 [Paracoccus sphaerophysae]
MMAIIRLAAIVIAIEALFYVMLSYYLRSLRRERLEEEWAERHPAEPGDSPERDEFVRRSMHDFHRTLRSRLVALVFMLPTLAIFVIAYLVNNR